MEWIKTNNGIGIGDLEARVGDFSYRVSKSGKDWIAQYRPEVFTWFFISKYQELEFSLNAKSIQLSRTEGSKFRFRTRSEAMEVCERHYKLLVLA